jgi:hypothetical protein
MKCPHCAVDINENFTEKFIGGDPEGYWSVFHMNCPNPECKKLIIELRDGDAVPEHRYGLISISNSITVRPLVSSRPPVPSQVDKLFSEDYNEACLILSFSPKASAALSRRCLQNILREKAGVKHGNLSNEIQQVIDSRMLPSYLNESIDAIRNIGNFAAHPSKSTTTGEIIPIEQGEAEWLLDVIESLFDFYFVQPALLKAKRDALNQKLAEAGKPAMK